MPRSTQKTARRAEMLPWLLLFGSLSMLVLTLVVGRVYLQHRLGATTAAADAARQATQDLTQRLRTVEGEKAALEEKLLRAEKSTPPSSEGAEVQPARLGSAQEELALRFREELRTGRLATQRSLSDLRVILPDEALFEEAGGTRLSRSGEELLSRLASVLARGRDKHVQVASHVDGALLEGTAAKAYRSGWELSAARAVRIARFLSERGQLPASSLSATGVVAAVIPQDGAQGESGKKVRAKRVELIVTESAWGDAAPVEPAVTAAPAAPRPTRTRKMAKVKQVRAQNPKTPAARTAAR